MAVGFILARIAMRNALLLSALWLLAAASSPAAPPSARLSGVVLNSKGTPVVARVFWQTADGTQPHVLRTDAHGQFRVTQLRGGLYDLRAEAAGWWSKWEQNVVVKPGRSASITLRLVRTTPPRALARRRARK
jgi:Carboxypeptidase regulatory-like domain